MVPSRDGTRCDPLTILNHYSRYLIASQLVAGTGGGPLARCSRFSVATACRESSAATTATPSPVGGERIESPQRVVYAFGDQAGGNPPCQAPGQQAHERMHRTLKEEAATPPYVASAAESPEALFVDNTTRRGPKSRGPAASRPGLQCIESSPLPQPGASRVSRLLKSCISSPISFLNSQSGRRSTSPVRGAAPRNPRPSACDGRDECERSKTQVPRARERKNPRSRPGLVRGRRGHWPYSTRDSEAIPTSRGARSSLAWISPSGSYKRAPGSMTAVRPRRSISEVTPSAETASEPWH